MKARPDNAADTALEQAIAWAVRLQSGSATEAMHADCRRWRAGSPAAEAAWLQVQGLEQDLHALSTPKQLAFRTLAATAALAHGVSPARRRALKMLGIGALGLGAGLLARELRPWQPQRMTYSTAIGERRSFDLPDGSRLLLNTGSEVEMAYTAWRRELKLRRGEMLIETGRDADSRTGHRRFIVVAGSARLEALGTRFSVRQDGDRTRLHVIQGRVAVSSDLATGQVIASAGEGYVVNAHAARVTRIDDPRFDAQAWTEGVLEARQMRLDAFVTELARYSRAPLHCDASVAALRVSGVFQLDGADVPGRTLAALAATLPVRVVASIDGGYTLTRR